LQLPEWVEATLIRANNFERPDQLHSIETADNWGADARVPKFDDAPRHSRSRSKEPKSLARLALAPFLMLEGVECQEPIGALAD